MATPLFVERAVVFIGFCPFDVAMSFSESIQNLTVVPLSPAAIIPIPDSAIRAVVRHLFSMYGVVFTGRTKALIHHFDGLASRGVFLFETVAFLDVFPKFFFAERFVPGHGGGVLNKQE